jgi:hypothetical protein
VLDPLGTIQQSRVDLDQRKRPPDGRHQSPDRLEERGAGILHQVPTGGDLHSVRRPLGCGLPVTAASVTRDSPRDATQTGFWLSGCPTTRFRMQSLGDPS